MYREYWNLHKAPFDNVPDSSMYVDCHASMETVISETIFAIKEANDSFAVIIGDAGLGKTLSLRIIIDSLEPHRYQVVSIINPSLSFGQLLREIIGQITGKQCEEKNKSDLLEIFNRLIVETVNAGRKIVIFIDEANAISPANLENLRLLTNIQQDRTTLFTIVLAGQMALARRLEHPKRANLFQRIGTYGRIDKLPSQEALKTYMETRLKLAGAQRKIFTDECMPIIWEYSEQGIPRLINKICKLCLKYGETNEFRIITPDVASQIGDRFSKLSETAYQQRRPRKRQEITFSDEELSQLACLTSDKKNLSPPPREDSFSQDQSSSVPDNEQSPGNENPLSATPPEDISEIIRLEKEASMPEESASEIVYSQKISPVSETETMKSTLSLQNDFIKTESSSEVLCDEPAAAHPSVSSSSSFQLLPAQLDEQNNESRLDAEEIIVAGHIIRLNIPKSILKQVNTLNPDNANKSAGFWAGQIIKNHPELTGAPSVDPVHLWNEIKDNI